VGVKRPIDTLPPSRGVSEKPRGVFSSALTKLLFKPPEGVSRVGLFSAEPKNTHRGTPLLCTTLYWSEESDSKMCASGRPTGPDHEISPEIDLKNPIGPKRVLAREEYGS